MGNSQIFYSRVFHSRRKSVRWQLATKRLRKIGPVKRDAIFCSFFLWLLHWERPISTSRLIIRSWLIGVERRLLIVGLRTVCASSIFSSIIDPKRDDIVQDFVSYFVECWFSYGSSLVFFSIKSSSIECAVIIILFL